LPFFETSEFPTPVSFKAFGGPAFKTEVKQGYSGQEQRNRDWKNCRNKWTISLLTPANGFTRQQFVDMVSSYFLVVGGKADGFRFKDHKDFKAVGQTMGIVSGTVFQLQKTYTVPAPLTAYVRKITKPITSATNNYVGAPLANTVNIYVSGVLQTSGYTLDPTTGLVTFGSAPAATPTADFQFHHPARLDTDDLNRQVMESFVAGDQPLMKVSSIQLLEVRL
jgi:uncharacterized protein (TIGR02217 family)